jgi:hypothetical protein
MILSSTDHLDEFIGSIGRLPPPIGTLLGPENIVWDLKPAPEAHCAPRISLAVLRCQTMFSGLNKVLIGGGRRLMDPMNSAKRSVDLKIMFEASNPVLIKNKIIFRF